ncbi:pyridoxamine 5'-phosphate oxidase family protein [Streptomyces sp. NPDC005808]|uniref:pyridoxamine 5'-phosphate oxidase family protein n=1 Tax=Streptomyces sp. NPDC005808 TaxID=3364734 RepID=UPI0036B139BF
MPDAQPATKQPVLEQFAVELIGRTDYGRMATSMRALPFLAFARHIVADGHVLLRMPRNLGYHQACDASIVAYGTDNLNSARPGEGLWTAQIVGRCEMVEPTEIQLGRFGPAPRLVDGEPYEPVYLGIEPQFGAVHATDGGLERRFQHVL